MDATKIAFLIMIALNGLSARSFDTVAFNTIITPPSYTFSVWGVIFAAMGVMTFIVGSEPNFPVKNWNVAQLCLGLWPVIFAAVSNARSESSLEKYRHLLLLSVATLAMIVANAYICWSSDYNSLMIRLGSGLLVGWTLAATMLNVVFAIKYWNPTIYSSVDLYLALPFYSIGAMGLWWMSTQPNGQGWTMMITLVWALMNSLITFLGIRST
jgi:hypothetical protein